MKTLINSAFFLLMLCLLFITCGKEELTFNPDINEDSSFEELLETTSFFDRKQTTFIITEEEYETLIVSRDSVSFIFQSDDIFDNFDQYTHISYPYFSGSPELFFMGKISDLNENGNQISFSTTPSEYADLYDDFLINTSRPNDYATTRDENNFIDLGTIYPKLLNLSLPEIPSYLQYVLDLISPPTSSTFLLSNELSLSPRGTMKGLITYISTPNKYGVNIENFELIDFGVESTFAEPDCDFPRLKQEIQDPPESSFYEDVYAAAMANPIADNIVFGDKTIFDKAIPATGCNVLLLLGIDYQYNGDFLLNLTAELNTTKPIDINIEFSASNPLNYNMTIEGEESNSLSKFITYETDAYIGAKAEATFEILAGLGVSDLANKAQIGLLLGASAEGELTGQIGRADINGTSNDFMNGCGSLKVKTSGYIYGSIDEVSENFNIPNTGNIFQTTIWDIAKDTKYAGNDPTITYTQVCHPDNCTDIITNQSYLRLEANANDEFSVSYYIKNRDDNPGNFSLGIKSPTRSETIVVDGTYNQEGSLTAVISDENLSSALASQDQANLNFTVTDIFSGCEKTMPVIVFGNPCDNTTFSHPSTNIVLRAYNIDNESDGINTFCTTSSDPIWTYDNESLAALNNFAPDYQTINYMSYDRCQCYADKLTQNQSGTYVIPTSATMEQFADDTYDFYFAMVEGNTHCSNFVPSGYATKSFFLCSDFLSNNQPIAQLTTQTCITSMENAYFHVNNTGSDGLNDYLFQLDPESYITIKEVAKGTLAPCRLQKTN